MTSSAWNVQQAASTRTLKLLSVTAAEGALKALLFPTTKHLEKSQAIALLVRKVRTLPHSRDFARANA